LRAKAKNDSIPRASRRAGKSEALGGQLARQVGPGEAIVVVETERLCRTKGGQVAKVESDEVVRRKERVSRVGARGIGSIALGTEEPLEDKLPAVRVENAPHRSGGTVKRDDILITQRGEQAS
jgi:hypothetical protein